MMDINIYLLIEKIVYRKIIKLPVPWDFNIQKGTKGILLIQSYMMQRKLL